MLPPSSLLLWLDSTLALRLRWNFLRTLWSLSSALRLSRTELRLSTERQQTLVYSCILRVTLTNVTKSICSKQCYIALMRFLLKQTGFWCRIFSRLSYPRTHIESVIATFSLRDTSGPSTNVAERDVTAQSELFFFQSSSFGNTVQRYLHDLSYKISLQCSHFLWVKN